MNRLQYEKSPYLLQHKDNPVDWYPWGEEAFEKAKEEGKPIFLSIGYSTCHWCHVMAHESFEDPETAKLLNECFVSIKVDREERPDVDSIYMRVCQMLNQQGGWPLSVFLTPEQKPFYAGTYFPKQSMHGIPSFSMVITQLYEQYKQDPDKITRASNQITKVLNMQYEVDQAHRLDRDVLHQVFEQLQQSFDDAFGGFGGAPKFPRPHMMMFLFRYYHWTGEEKALSFALETLDSIAAGGIHDHVGKGFARYAVDEKWLVPHFEKMLYDNAMLLMAYTEAYQVTGNERYRKICEGVVSFLDREMTNEAGAFYSAIDADSEGQEGKYYTWSFEEVYDILGESLGDLFTDVYQMTPHGNFEGNNIPHLINVDIVSYADRYGLDPHELDSKLEEGRVQLLAKREERVYPHVDDKILTSWNSLTIAALAKAGRVFHQSNYLAKAKQAIQFIESNLVVEQRLMKRYREGEVKHKGFLDDYAFLAWAYVEMYEATFEPEYLQSAQHTVQEMEKWFFDEANGGYFFSGSDDRELIAKDKEAQDGALPSANSVAAMVLQKMARLTGDVVFQEKATSMLATFKKDVEAYPAGFTMFLHSLLQEEAPAKELVFVGKSVESDEVVQHLQSHFHPFDAIIYTNNPAHLKDLAPYLKDYQQIDAQPSLYICEQFTCQQPTTKLWEAVEQLYHK
ncbi:thioredoxin domain-containing protein [Pontibacillus salicampi]|uniref:Thioredoxin domain-containing protein n=1 Tax=Pontibacillus salicampi TaxID=1449801 RepID=A0ABV6LKV9_9BACI